MASQRRAPSKRPPRPAAKKPPPPPEKSEGKDAAERGRMTSMTSMIVATTYTRDLLPELERQLSAAIARIDAGEFMPTPSEFTCSGCPALDLVCAGPRLRQSPTQLLAVG